MRVFLVVRVVVVGVIIHFDALFMNDQIITAVVAAVIAPLYERNSDKRQVKRSALAQHLHQVTIHTLQRFPSDVLIRVLMVEDVGEASRSEDTIVSSAQIFAIFRRASATGLKTAVGTVVGTAESLVARMRLYTRTTRCPDVTGRSLCSTSAYKANHRMSLGDLTRCRKDSFLAVVTKHKIAAAVRAGERYDHGTEHTGNLLTVAVLREVSVRAVDQQVVKLGADVLGDPQPCLRGFSQVLNQGLPRGIGERDARGLDALDVAHGGVHDGGFTLAVRRLLAHVHEVFCDLSCFRQ